MSDCHVSEPGTSAKNWRRGNLSQPWPIPTTRKTTKRATISASVDRRTSGTALVPRLLSPPPAPRAEREDLVHEHLLLELVRGIRARRRARALGTRDAAELQPLADDLGHTCADEDPRAHV